MSDHGSSGESRCIGKVCYRSRDCLQSKKGAIREPRLSKWQGLFTWGMNDLVGVLEFMPEPLNIQSTCSLVVTMSICDNLIGMHMLPSQPYVTLSWRSVPEIRWTWPRTYCPRCRARLHCN